MFKKSFYGHFSLLPGPPYRTLRGPPLWGPQRGPFPEQADRSWLPGWLRLGFRPLVARLSAGFRLGFPLDFDLVLISDLFFFDVDLI